MAKTIFEYEGVKMSSLESMFFSLWLEKQNFTMNTLYKEQRLKVINDWLENYRKNEQRD
jgi:hypothetical protein